MPASLAATLIMGRSGEPLLAFRRSGTGKVLLIWSEVLLDGWMNPLVIMASLLSIMELRAQESLMFTHYHIVHVPFTIRRYPRFRK